MLTPEQRAEWRKDAEAYRFPRDIDRKRVLALLDALDLAEARAEQWQSRYDEMVRSATYHRERAEQAERKVAYLKEEVARLVDAEEHAAALTATLDRVRALADEWDVQSYSGIGSPFADELRAALAEPKAGDR